MPATKTRIKRVATDHSDHEQQLENFFVDSLKDIDWAEKHLTRALAKMRKASTTVQLQEAISNHMTQTEEHISRLENVFEQLGEKPRGKKCDAIEGLIAEGETAIEETEDGTMTRDAAIIMSSQKVEHYEIATYGMLTQLAATMGKNDVAAILSQTLREEKETDELLTEIAVNSINWKAEQEGKKEGVV